MVARRVECCTIRWSLVRSGGAGQWCTVLVRRCEQWCTGGGAGLGQGWRWFGFRLAWLTSWSGLTTYYLLPTHKGFIDVLVGSAVDERIGQLISVLIFAPTLTAAFFRIKHATVSAYELSIAVNRRLKWGEVAAKASDGSRSGASQRQVRSRIRGGHMRIIVQDPMTIAYDALRTTHQPPLATHHAVLTSHFSLLTFTAHCSLRAEVIYTAHRLLLTAYCAFLIAYHVPLTTHSI